MDDVIVRILLLLPVLAIVEILVLVLCQTGTSDRVTVSERPELRQLSDYIEHYEPLHYDVKLLQIGHHRVKRFTDQHLQLKMHAYGRTFKVRLKRDSGVYSRDLVVENDRGAIYFDASRAYRGHLEGEEGESSVYGVITTDGLFEGRIRSGTDEYSVERSRRYFKYPDVPPSFHSVIYHLSSIRMENLNSSLCRSRNLGSQKRQQQQRTTPSNNDNNNASNADNRPRSKRSSSWSNPWTGYSDGVGEGPGDGGDLFRGERYVYRPPDPAAASPGVPSSHRRPIDRLKTTCTMYIQADHLFYEKFDSNEDTVVEQLTQHVQGVNEIYGRIDFDGNSTPDNINFIIKRIKVWTDVRTPGYKFSGQYGVETFLELLSEEDFDAFCLAYMFTYRDFDGGTLGLAWTGDLQNAGGVCEKHGQYRGSSKSLNSGIVTILNYGKDVPPSVSHVTMAHEVGHNIGSQHDPETAECSPGGADGNYIMYARATSGDRPNNNKFSKCSTQSMAQVISAKAQGEHGCFIPATSGICGNGVVEEGEECDCGWEDECREQCCYPQTSTEGLGVPCTRRNGAECSPSEGPCCSDDCQLIGRLSSFDKQVCRESTKCKNASFCNGSSSICPPSIDLPNKTRCDEDAVCFLGVREKNALSSAALVNIYIDDVQQECTGSMCLAFDLEPCQCPPFRDGDFKDPTLCRLCCKEPGPGKPCRSSFQWNREPYNVPDLNLKPGASCYNNRGYCDVFLKCKEIDPTGPLSSLKRLFSAEGMRSVRHWFSVYWYIPSIVGTSLFAFLAILIKLCNASSSSSSGSSSSDPVVRTASEATEPHPPPTKPPPPPSSSSSSSFVRSWLRRRSKRLGASMRVASVRSTRDLLPVVVTATTAARGGGGGRSEEDKTRREFASWV